MALVSQEARACATRTKRLQLYCQDKHIKGEGGLLKQSLELMGFTASDPFLFIQSPWALVLGLGARPRLWFGGIGFFNKEDSIGFTLCRIRDSRVSYIHTFKPKHLSYDL